MANVTDEPADSIVLSTEAAIRAYVHPVRIEMAKRLARAEMTLSQLAAAMGTIPANLSRHLKRLADAGLVALVRTKDTGKNLEKYYRARAKAFRVERGGEPKDKARAALAILRDGLEDALSEGNPPLDGSLAYMANVRLGKKKKAELYARLERLVEEFAGFHDETGESLVMSLAVYPGIASAFSGERIVL
jgi:DNA-binding transcriptional ArsR family regulator